MIPLALYEKLDPFALGAFSGQHLESSVSRVFILPASPRKTLLLYPCIFIHHRFVLHSSKLEPFGGRDASLPPSLLLDSIRLFEFPLRDQMVSREDRPLKFLTIFLTASSRSAQLLAFPGSDPPICILIFAEPCAKSAEVLFFPF